MPFNRKTNKTRERFQECSLRLSLKHGKVSEKQNTLIPSGDVCVNRKTQRKSVELEALVFNLRAFADGFGKREINARFCGLCHLLFL